ncbi:MAG: prephenate dehydrogenase/arogenate dehydrogenase family protein [Trichlorobacter sp.]|uniref:prephenate dehydrogenase n=1 Tax=Trichlorobacter sp. TaxID=2911007 RepID=UPI00256AFA09|nr:prephenate dehydrogenase/arogenate dehydrogenase family protein [Trichlorobacter sp.]MDK9718482.1 prephenate dehydrogenase/arogenate dehydrogenase family protein [Trichlorobacter sp.]
MIKTLAVIGVGLIGGSFSRALKAAGVVQRVIGFDLDPDNLAEALQLGVVDEVAADYAAAVSAADLVFLAVPVRAMTAAVTACAPYLPAGCVVTDGGSVKEDLVAACEPLMPEGCHFVGGHPISGTEHSGAKASFATLFQGRRCILTPTGRTNQQALELVQRLWEAAGSRVECMEPLTHDRVFAAVSHLPHMVAYALVHAVDRSAEEEENILAFSAGGFRDFTRIASSDPSMWRDIALMNRLPLLSVLDRYQQEFAALKEKVAAGDGVWLENYFTTSKRLRDEII